MPNLNYYNIQKAIYDKLIGNSQLMAIVSGIFDYPPQSAQFPFVRIDNPSSADIPSLAELAKEYRFDINIFAREAGNKQVYDIIEIIYGLLHNGTISVVGKTLVFMRCEGSSISLENDGWTYQGNLRLRIGFRDN